jgi:hypothetical protein
VEPPLHEPDTAKANRHPDDVNDSDDEEDNDDDGRGQSNQEAANARAIYLARRPGRIPDGLGVTIINNKYERDNDLWMMAGRYFYHSLRSNCIFAGKTTAVASDYEG